MANANVTNVLNPRNINFFIGTYEVTNFANADDAMTFSTNSDLSNLAQGLNATTITYAANVSVNLKIKLLSSGPDNDIIFAFAQARYQANNGLLPDGLAPVGTLLNDIPLTIYFNSPLASSFQLITRSYTITNIADFNIPYSGPDRLEREWNFKFTLEVQDLLGAFSTF